MTVTMDLHRCGDCQKEFDSFENFLIHKLVNEQYRLTLEPSERIPGLRLPRFIKPKSQFVEYDVTTSADEEGVKDKTSPEEEPDLDNDDSVSVSSQTESLRIDESAKDILMSPIRDCQSSFDGKQEAFCNICDRHYKNNVILRVHQSTVHSVSRPYVCEYCHQAFKSKGSLVRHARTHTGERPFKCQECNRAFHDSGSLSRHRHKLHPAVANTRPKDIQVLITRLLPEENSTG